MTENVQGLVDVGKLVLAFAKVNRVTLHEDGVRPESDTDHTVMVSLCALVLADKFYTDTLDKGLVAQFAIVHDLVEAYAMDTDSFGINEEDKKAKDDREHEAFLRIQHEFIDVYPWLPVMIEKYESLDTREARFVKTVDKLMTKITHILNGGEVFKLKGMQEETMANNYLTMVKTAEDKYGKEFPEMIELMRELIAEAKRKTYEQ